MVLFYDGEEVGKKQQIIAENVLRNVVVTFSAYMIGFDIVFSIFVIYRLKKIGNLLTKDIIRLYEILETILS